MVLQGKKNLIKYTSMLFAHKALGHGALPQLGPPPRVGPYSNKARGHGLYPHQNERIN